MQQLEFIEHFKPQECIAGAFTPLRLWSIPPWHQNWSLKRPTHSLLTVDNTQEK